MENNKNYLMFDLIKSGILSLICFALIFLVRFFLTTHHYFNY
ncbi:MAG TPA: hypothetical protein P5299_00140 [Candidatus Woesebacteria bacterium]|nr:hypothetical protein [Candidatus Woesebacteria bacterium]HRT39757.1 hypothetical protein [Candidatus Woesebacteria bacterium]